MCFIAELDIPAENWHPPGQVSVFVGAMPAPPVRLRAQACQGHLFAGPLGTPDDARHPAWIDLGPIDDLGGPTDGRKHRRVLAAAVWAAWLEQVGWGVPGA